VSQSGALVTAVLDWAKARRVGFSTMVSLGERLDVDFGDVIDYLASDAHTRSILLYVESIEAPRKFMSAARAAARNKPVIVVKAGRAGNGIKAAASHTGALAGSDIVFDAAIRRAGMLRVDTLQDLFMAAETLACFHGNRDDALTIMTNGGGAGCWLPTLQRPRASPLRDLAPETRAKLDAALPATWSHGNPIDIIGDAPVERYTKTLQALLADPTSGAVLFLHAPTAIVRSQDIARACAPTVRAATGRVMACWLGDAAVAEARDVFADAGVAQYETPEEAIRAFAMLATYRRNQALLLEVPTASGNAPLGSMRRVRCSLAPSRKGADCSTRTTPRRCSPPTESRWRRRWRWTCPQTPRPPRRASWAFRWRSRSSRPTSATSLTSVASNLILATRPRCDARSRRCSRRSGGRDPRLASPASRSSR
jgi:acetyltransferase